jgi:site-specific DNA-methyltransferase (adenine-specific)
MRESQRKPTGTSNFGVSRREAHDASAFYARFEAPELSDDEAVAPRFDVVEPCIHGDIRDRDDVPDGSVALVVTSPPYFAGKQYEEELGEEGVPASYADYLELLTTVFDACKQKLEPGGRIAVNVANLGRKPYRSLSADVITILQDRLKLLLRGEIIWKKGEGAGGNCAWGSFKRPGNPVLRDLTERVVVASKGRFDRAISQRKREAAGLPHRSFIWGDDYMQRTLDVWEIPPESATRVGHPAPFPVELPQWLIELYTYEDDLVLDPFLGSGSTLVAAARLGRRGIGYDTDAQYVDLARRRLAIEVDEVDEVERVGPTSEAPVPGDPALEFRARATTEGLAAKALAAQLLEQAGFRNIRRKVRVRGTGVTLDFEAFDAGGRRFWFDVSGGFSSSRAGLLRSDAVWKALGQASVLRGHPDRAPVVLLSSQPPKPGSEGDVALRASRRTGATVFDVVQLTDPDGYRRLEAYARGRADPLPGYWTPRDLGR